MSAPSEILLAIESRTNAVIDTYKRLKFSYDLELNDYRNSEKGYGIGAGLANSVTGTNRTITLDQEFFVVLTQKIGGRRGDKADRDALRNIYDDLELLYRDLFQSKIGIPATVYLVSELSLDEPLMIGDNVISVRMNFIVKHRKDT